MPKPFQKRKKTDIAFAYPFINYLQRCGYAQTLYTYQARLITPSNSATIAITSNACIRLPAWLKKKPNIHPITRITAMMYNIPLIVVVCYDCKSFPLTVLA